MLANAAIDQVRDQVISRSGLSGIKCCKKRISIRN